MDAKHGANTIESGEAPIFRMLAARAKRVVVLADSGKVGQVSPALVCPSRSIHVLVTGSGISPDLLHAFEKCGVEVLAP